MRPTFIVSLVACSAAACGPEPSARDVSAQFPEPAVASPPEPTASALSAAPAATAAAPASAAAPSSPEPEPPGSDEDIAKRCAEQHPRPYPVIAGEDPDVQVDLRASATLSALAPAGSSGGAAKTVASMAPAFRRCFTRGLVCDPEMQGSTRIAAKIDADGRVTSATPIKAKGLSKGVLDCLVGVVSKRTFDKPEGGGATIVIPVVFVTAG